ncbi:site-specific integrase [Streptosporangium sp. NPDC051023]|uniref:tyrosine-type recombinase/integrase n=1 Tax=Streptosporangium sp. NPDC051023 TaxID=3155410 RepID=UPI00344BE781
MRNGVRWSVGLALGLRQGEALGLRWKYLDLKAGSIFDVVFAQTNGRPIGTHDDWEEWKAILVAANVREARVHDARHTAGTLLIEQGVHVRTVQEILGHSDIRLTQRYTHFDDTFVADLRTVSSVDEAGEVLVHGAELGPLLDRHGIDLTSEESGKLNGWLTVLLRVTTDGTLTDAMRTATFTERGPEHLVSIHDMDDTFSADEPWEERLSAVTHPALRDHLSGRSF